MAAFEALLEEQGGLYTFGDVLESLARGEMQSFTKNDTMVVTQIRDFPRRTVLDVLFAVGDIDEVIALVDDQVTSFAKDIGVTMITSTGRKGWKKRMTPGWRDQWSSYSKDI